MGAMWVVVAAARGAAGEVVVGVEPNWNSIQNMLNLDATNLEPRDLH